MDQQIIKDALYSALTLVNQEVESVIVPDYVKPRKQNHFQPFNLS